MKNIKNKMFLAIIGIIVTMAFTGCSSLTNKNLKPVSASADEIVKTVKNSVNSSGNQYLEYGLTDEETIYGTKFETMMLDCKSNNKMGYIDLYKFPAFETQTFENSAKNEGTTALLYYLSAIKDISLKIEVEPKDAIQYLNNYYVYGEDFTTEHCKHIAETYDITEGLLIDSIVYHEGRVIFVFLKNTSDIDEARNLAHTAAPYLTSFKLILDEVKEEADKYTNGE